ncbi:MFS transporter [Actinoallomurus purpureus]|uniref:MFS transporter n=1 Tax=Actinoallomurus purpureus TaxID=478114 RepID=UPI002092D7DE|nr:MFS transporter [Actinoallomurus purpureus]MCO6006144.1 MFS transporter [Actinoallomurus purpureus]
MNHTASAHAHVETPPDPRRWPALALLSLAQFMLILDVTVVNVALPSMGQDLHLGREALTWAVTAYTLCFGGLMLLGGRLADAFGARRMVLTGLAVFTLASLTTGLASDGTTLITGRLAQGIGAALLSPAALAIVTTTFHGTERNKALGIWAAIGGAGSAIGVLLGGALTAGPGWQWVFFVNVPVGALVFISLPALLPTSASNPAARRIDLPGALAVTTATAALIYGLVKAGDAGWGGGAILISLAAAVILYGVFALIERSSRTPLMDLRMFAHRSVVAGAFLMLIATGLLISFFFLGSLYLQHARGFSALKTGLLFLPVAAATAIGAHLGSRLIGRIGGRPVTATGLVLAAIGAGALTRLSDRADVYSGLLPGFVIAAVGLGAVFVAATTTALAFVPHQEAGLASAVVNTFHEVGGSIGVAVVSTVAAAGIQAGTSAGFTNAFGVCTAAAAIGAAVAVGILPPGKPQITGGPHVH